MQTTQLSQSASFIAIKFYGLTRIDNYSAPFSDEMVRYYQNIVQALPAPLCYYHYWLQQRWVRSLYIAAEELLLPGDLMHVLARKWYISRMVDDLLADGYEQVLVLGAGFDHLAFRYARQGLPALELDSPRMAELKTIFFEDYYPGATPPDIMPLHLPDETIDDLLQGPHPLSAEKKTVVIAEGFFDYLRPGTVNTVLAALRRHFTDPALVSTHFALDELNIFHRLVFQSSLRLVNERLAFGASMQSFNQHLVQHGFSIQKKYDAREICSRFPPCSKSNLKILNGFYLFCAV